MTPGLRFPAAAVRTEVRRLAGEVALDHPAGVVLVAVLPDALHLVCDLARDLTVPVELAVLLLSSYDGGSPRVRIELDVDVDVTDRPVVLVTGALDTGLRAGYVLGVLASRGPASLRVCTLVDRQRRRILPVAADYVGFPTDDDLLVGYGLALAGRGGNVAGLSAVDPARPAADAGASSAGGRDAGRPAPRGDDDAVIP